MRAIRPKLSQLHQGRSLFFVSVSPSRDRPALEATMRAAVCMGRPYNARIYSDEVSLFIHTEYEGSFFPGKVKAKRSLNDCAVVWHGGRNLHRMFVKEKQARKYMDRINAGCLSAAERSHLADSLRWGRHY